MEKAEYFLPDVEQQQLWITCQAAVNGGVARSGILIEEHSLGTTWTSSAVN